ncbi:sulfurtransferase-like selenium metabolism protein YedF [Campylobacter sp. 19-13652]|uniref:sulfurtransferase-like selenium metabolism protein YedF n=1 Tax=Campylobacter sp. 19-13652 TaxID=2840180 RepID=UPI001C776BD2|nr:sulfurtransferase-like selenium metabolism protein YedF [Campylobacter sp. 19-13652]BCX80007.1 hypothetical protein LBC_14690 [Campylobacter sp. 19-13652]
MRIDCKGLECPQPVIHTKKALEGMAVGEWLEIEINSKIVLENVLKFINYSGYEASVDKVDENSEICIIKVQKTDGTGHTAPLSAKPSEKSNISTQNRLNSDSIDLTLAPHEEVSLEPKPQSKLTHSARKKVIYLNDDRAGNGEVGLSLLAKLLSSFALLSEHIEAVACVNNGVFVSTTRSHPALASLKELEQKGVRIISCGACLTSYKLTDKVLVGEIGNAYEIAQLLVEFDEIKL